MSLTQSDLTSTRRNPLEGSEEVEVPEFHGTVRLRLLGYRELKRVADLENGKKDSDPYLFSRVVIDDDGGQLFPDEKSVGPFLDQLTAPTYKRLTETISRMNGLGTTGREDVAGN